jgi:hypothetical protein
VSTLKWQCELWPGVVGKIRHFIWKGANIRALEESFAFIIHRNKIARKEKDASSARYGHRKSAKDRLQTAHENKILFVFYLLLKVPEKVGKVRN